MSARSHELPGAAPIDLPPRRAARRRGPRHPDARADELRERAAASFDGIPRRGEWHFEFGFSVALQNRDGSWTVRDARSYADAIDVRARELETGNYEQAWIRMKNA